MLETDINFVLPGTKQLDCTQSALINVPLEGALKPVFTWTVYCIAMMTCGGSVNPRKVTCCPSASRTVKSCPTSGGPAGGAFFPFFPGNVTDGMVLMAVITLADTNVQWSGIRS